MSTSKQPEVHIPSELPLIALKNTVLFPKIVIPLIMQRQKSVNAMQAASDGNRLVLFVTQKNLEDTVTEKDLYRTGTVGRIVSSVKLPDGSFKVDVEGLVRAKITEITDEADYFRSRIEPFELMWDDKNVENEALVRRVVEQFRALVGNRMFPVILPDVAYVMSRVKDLEQIISLVTANLNLEVQDQQNMLEMHDGRKALRRLGTFLAHETDIAEVERNLDRETKKKIGKMQKEVYLREQLKSIEKELGVEEGKEEFDVLQKKIKTAKMPKEVQERAEKELNRLVRMPPFNPEASYLRTYLDWLVELPWFSSTKDKINLKQAQKVLDKDHYGLKKVKERIIEYLAVQKQVGKLKGPILCLVGPPGTGKTSVGQSIARALGRKFVRVSLGGLRDEAEIRGHRKTYVGAMPGRIIQGIHTAKSHNPVFMLDEIDKVGMDFRGDPSAALLEALDPQQNHAFSDHYLEVPYDLSDVFFITTANVLETIPPALRDRLEIIDFPGYTEDEKLHIAKRFLIPKLLNDHGLKKNTISFKDSAVSDVIRYHTHEAGVRNLERELASVVRKVTRSLVEKPSRKRVSVTRKELHKYLGPKKFSHQMAEKKDEIGVVTGLGWTPMGGEILNIEATKMPGKGRLILTGQLGDVMKESAQAALSYARNRVLRSSGVRESFVRDDIHVHVPSGAIKKDGPSAGIAITTALVSLFTGKPVKKDVCMTGEVTLRGKVLEIGGVKEKILAAHRARLKTVLLPLDNKKDLEDIPKDVRRDMKFIFVKSMSEVLKHALR